MIKLLLGIVAGLIIGAGSTLYYLSGGFAGSAAPGTLILPPDASGPPAGRAEIRLREEFFNEVVGTIFRDMNHPTYALGGGDTTPGQECPNAITLIPEGSGVRTGATFEGGHLGARLAFSGSYNSMFGCLRFTGWAPANLELRYDAGTQTVFGQLNVETVNLDGVNPAVSVLLTALVQSTLNARVNPIKVIDGAQVGIDLPIAATGSHLKASVEDVRAEIRDRELLLYITYEMSGSVGSGDASATLAP
jgi:hypothetical protein